MKLELIPSDEITPEDLDWLETIPEIGKVGYKEMRFKVLTGEWMFWRFRGKAQGAAVGYPENGKLFIYYLRAERFFGNITKDDLLEAARDVGFNSIRALVQKPAVKFGLARIGFVEDKTGPDWAEMELSNGR